MNEEDVKLSFKTTSVIITSIVMFLITYGFIEFVSDIIDFVKRYYGY